MQEPRNYVEKKSTRNDRRKTEHIHKHLERLSSAIVSFDMIVMVQSPGINFFLCLAEL